MKLITLNYLTNEGYEPVKINIEKIVSMYSTSYDDAPVTKIILTQGGYNVREGLEQIEELINA